MPTYSFVIPVYNRPRQLACLLDSMNDQSFKPVFWEIHIVEDGSTESAEELVGQYQAVLPIQYHYKQRGGPSSARNYGTRMAKGEYIVFVDSDTMLPADYLQKLEDQLFGIDCALGGGPDGLVPQANVWQRAVNYAMTSYLTTGGIRGKKMSMETFKPRAHNMCARKDVFTDLKGFNTSMRYGEDIDFSLRAEAKGYVAHFFPHVEVRHFRKNSLRAFFHQTYQSGKARGYLAQAHPGSLRLVHALPALANILGLCFIALGMFISYQVFLWVFILFVGIIFAHAWRAEKNPLVGMLSVVTSACQIMGYGMGHISYHLFFRRSLLAYHAISFFLS